MDSYIYYENTNNDNLKEKLSKNFLLKMYLQQNKD